MANGKLDYIPSRTLTHGIPYETLIKTHIYYKDNIVWGRAKVDYGHYETIPDLIKDVNKALAKYAGNGNIVLSLNALTGKVKVQLKSGYGLSLFERMSLILGFG